MKVGFIDRNINKQKKEDLEVNSASFAYTKWLLV